MANRLDNLTAVFSNVKTRTIIILALVILVLVLVVGFFGFRRANQAANTAQLTKAGNLQSVPGLQTTSPQYAQVQQEVNQQNYKQASETQGTAIPTIVNQRSIQATNNPDAYNVSQTGGANNGSSTNLNGVNGANGVNGSGVDPNATTGTSATGNNAGDNADSKLTALEAQQKQQLDDMQKKMNELNSQQEQQQQQQTQGAMQKEAQQLLAAWNGGAATPSQRYVIGDAANQTQTTSTTQALNSATANTPQIGGNAYGNSDTMIKAGTILFATLDTSVNSDEPGPVMATVVSGTYKGAKLIGSIQKSPQLPGSNGASKLILSFSTMSIPYLPDSISISAVAVDPDTARTALASDVDHHYLERYGSLFASSFLEGWGNEIASSGQQVFVTPFGGTITTQSGQSRSNPLSTQNLAAGLGTVGTNWGQQLGDNFNRQNTVTINAGISLGLLFLDDVSPGGGNKPTATTTQMSNTVTTTTVGNTSPTAMTTTEGTGTTVTNTGPAPVPVPTQ